MFENDLGNAVSPRRQIFYHFEVRNVAQILWLVGPCHQSGSSMRTPNILAAAIVVTLAAPAAAQGTRRNNSYAMAPNGSYCAQRYRSYDPASGTYMGYDGRRHPC